MPIYQFSVADRATVIQRETAAVMDFRFTFEDHEEAEITFRAFAETCRQLKATLSNRTKPTAAASAIVLGPYALGEAGDGTTKAAAPNTRKGSKAKIELVKSESALEEKPSEYAPEKKLTVKVQSPKSVSLDEVRRTVKALTADKKNGGVHKVATILRDAGVSRLPDLKPEQYADVQRKLVAAQLDDNIPI